jgi:anthranilate synthase component 2
VKSILLYDSFDSFTHLLADYLRQLGAQVHVVLNNQALDSLPPLSQFDGVVLSPGPETPAKAGFLMPFLQTIPPALPVLGVCLGHQALGLLYGMELVRANFPMHGKVSPVIYTPHPLFYNVQNPFDACRYHSLVLVGSSPVLKVIAETEDKEVMAIAHVDLPRWGVQFHPEAILTKEGMQLLKNWFATL